MIASKIFQTFLAHPDNIRLKIQTPIIKKLVKSSATERALKIDIGCGTGRFIKLLENPYTNVVGIDTNFNALKRVRQKKIKALLVQGEIQNLPFRSGIFDTILLLEVLEHIADDIKGLMEVWKVLKTKGKLIISVPCPPPVYPDKAHKQAGYTKSQIFNLLRKVGFKILSYKFCMFRLSRIILKFAVNFISIFRFPPPILIILKLEKWLQPSPPFDIILEVEKP